MQETPRLLVVDDEHAIAELLARHLERENYRVYTAFDGDEALEALEKARFDLVITDIRMPGRDGLSLLEVAKSKDEVLPVIVLTSVTSVDTAVMAMRMGAEDYIVKPFNLEALTISVERALEKRGLVIENRQHQEALELAVEEKTRKLRLALSEVQGTFNATVEAMVSAIEARDCETQHHCRRAREYALMLAHRMGIRGRALRDVGWGSLLHDVGKIGVPDHILLKPGPLDDGEWALMRMHPIIGYRLLSPIRFLQGAAQVVLHHHEKWDGTGYPYGKKGEEIPIGARIFMLADAIETITSKRPYKEAQPFEFAEEEVRNCSGSHFDPIVVEAFEKIPRTNWLAVREKYMVESDNTQTLMLGPTVETAVSTVP
ncbi:MAG: HD domain-containing phosphohydrolase [Planctomycetota bacterium]|jgi:response regulator RpfG family c-di-GMP phosphodiesterase